MTIVPRPGYTLVEHTPETQVGSIIVPNPDDKPKPLAPNRGVVLAIGPDLDKDEEEFVGSPDVEVGDTVFFVWQQAEPLPGQYLVKHSDIIAVVRPVEQ